METAGCFGLIFIIGVVLIITGAFTDISNALASVPVIGGILSGSFDFVIGIVALIMILPIIALGVSALSD